MSSLQPDENPNPRFKWKPSDPASQGPSGNDDEPTLPKTIPLCIRQDSYDVFQIKANKLIVPEVAELAKQLNFSLPEDLIAHISQIADKGTAIDKEEFSSCSSLMQGMKVRFIRSASVDGNYMEKEWEYAFSRTENQSDESDLLISCPVKVDLVLHLRAGEESNTLQAVIDWNGAVFGSESNARERWEIARIVLAEAVPGFQLERLRYLSDFVDGEKSKGEMGPLLDFGKFQMVVDERYEDSKSANGKKENETEEEIDADSDAQLDWSEAAADTEREPEEARRGIKEKPARGQTLFVENPDGRRLERLANLCGLDLDSAFFNYLLEVMQKEEEPGEEILSPMRAVGRQVFFNKETTYQMLEGQPWKRSEMMLEDEEGPFGTVIMTIGQQCDENGRRSTFASMVFDGLPDDTKKLPWKKLLNAAGY